jgi:dTDP-4-dehydrorhamnose reductase
VSKIMVFGAGGQVGRHLIETGARLGRTMVALTRAETDICDPAAVGGAIARHRPTALVNAAAYTSVDKAESEQELAFKVNRDGALVLATAAAAADIPLLQLSTDYVFDGAAREPYREEDPVNPRGAYARSKEAGERAVSGAHDRYLILRTSWVYGPFGANFLRTMLRLGAERSEVGVVDDQTGCPTATGDIAAAILTMVDQAERADFSAWGTYHYAGRDNVTWYGFADMIFTAVARMGRKTPKLRPIATADYPTAAPRPAYSVLSTAKLSRRFGIEPKPARDGVAATLKRLLGEGGAS